MDSSGTTYTARDGAATWREVAKLNFFIPFSDSSWSADHGSTKDGRSPDETSCVGGVCSTTYASSGRVCS